MKHGRRGSSQGLRGEGRECRNVAGGEGEAQVADGKRKREEEGGDLWLQAIWGEAAGKEEEEGREGEMFAFAFPLCCSFFPACSPCCRPSCYFLGFL